MFQTNNINNGAAKKYAYLNKPISVAICVPGKNYSNNFLMAWTDMIYKFVTNSKYSIFISNSYNSYVPFARAKCLDANVLAGPDQKPFQNNLDYDVILWLDSDMIFSWEQIETLIDQCILRKSVVSGIYAMLGKSFYACAESWDLEYFVKNDTFKFLSFEDVEKYKKQGIEWIKCAFTGMGCMAIHRSIMDDPRLKYPWFSAAPYTINTGLKDMPIISEALSEDVVFIRQLIDKGIIDGVDVNITLRFGHEKTVIL